MRAWPVLALALVANIGLQQLARIIAPSAGRFEWPPWLARVGAALGDPTGLVFAADSLLCGLATYLLLLLLRVTVSPGTVLGPFAVLAAAGLVLLGIVELLAASAPSAQLAMQVARGGSAPLLRLGVTLGALILYVLVLTAIAWIIRRDSDAQLWRVALAVVGSATAVTGVSASLGGLPTENFSISAGSMFPTVQRGDVVRVNKWTRWWRTPARGEVVIRRTPDGTPWLYRVVALPGERVSLREGIVHINGVALPRQPAGVGTDPDDLLRIPTRLFRERAPEGTTWTIAKIRPDGPFDTMAELGVPDGKLFVLGDNRDNSMDSRMREVGLVPVAAVQGPVYRRITARADAPALTARAAE